ncbi:MAG: single-stranded-DNA-specific exonuclease RecJ [Gammaproteobacteria bacterium]|nr:single-stranded-DNA-specific exonuclease RecJ [Gammaproteobacteria bacterium]NVK89329.1 single-stranded-DNA-specific exonuclease RecJ [Gammaproteobacteria bacterium]
MLIKSIVRRTCEQIPTSLQTLPPLLQKLLAQRGVEDLSETDYSLANLIDYRLLSQIEAAAAAFVAARAQQPKVIIVGDFDADGATSTALLMLGLKTMGWQNVDYVVPNRFEFGYGLSVGIVDHIAAQAPDWIITVDNGISSLDGVARARELGIKVIITDHHLAPETLPAADYIINPNQPNDNFPSKAIAGVGVAFYTLVALRAELRRQGAFTNQSEPNLADWLDLVALGTVADVVPLDFNNRVLVANGLRRIRAGRCRPGILALLQLARRDCASAQASDLGFAVGPRLNAAGRLDDMSIGIETLLAEEPQQALRLAAELDDLNRYRREREQEMVAEAERALGTLSFTALADKPAAFCIYQVDWHQGIVGLVASRIKEKVNRPVIAFAREDEHTVKGSGRSIEGVHMRDVLANVERRQPGIMLKFGGHAMAAGLSIRLADLEQFQQLFVAETERWLAGQAIKDELVSDGSLSSEQLNLATSQLIEQAGPWGQSFPEPTFDGVFSVVEQRVVGEKHLKLKVSLAAKQAAYDAIYFFPPEDLLRDDLSQVELVYKVASNEFRGEVSFQLIVEQLRKIVEQSS